MKCCPRCFDDPHLTRSIFPKSSDRGQCSFCGALDQSLLDPAELRDLFEPLVEIYEPSVDGALMADLLKADWAMFPALDSANASRLLVQVLDEGELIRRTFKASAACSPASSIAWRQFRDELLHRNRFFLSTKLDEDRLRGLLAHLIAQEGDIPKLLYRARLNQGDKPFPREEMGAPPAHLATSGRANPPGIPYLYLASTPETAIAEIRPHTGEHATVAAFTVGNGLKIVDLRAPRSTVSPFYEEDDYEKIALLHGDLEFLVSWSDELTRPVIPGSVHVHYLPSQYLCEFVKSCGFDGVMYRSSIADGVNLTLFDPTRATIGVLDVFKVTAVWVSASKFAP